MDVLEAIMTRQSVAGMLPEAPDRETIETLLAAANRAPNHHLTQPWRFSVVKGAARDKLADAMEAAMRRRMTEQGETDPQKLGRSAMMERMKPFRAPVLVAVSVNRAPENEHIPAFEDLAATAAAVENMLLAAHGLGLGAYWRSGMSVFDPEVKQYLGLGDRDEIIAFVYLGFPDPNAPPRPVMEREDVAPRARWFGWDE
jgi:nitroreductase